MAYRVTIYSFALSAMLLMQGCSEPATVRVWPGMSVAAFNSANVGTDTLRTNDSDWIGINAPVDLVMVSGNRSVQFSDRSLGGGVQVASSKWRLDGTFRDTPGIVSVAFGIGRSVEDLNAILPQVVDQCAAMDAMAGRTPTPVANADQISAMMKSKPGSARDVTLCSGSGDGWSYSVTATYRVDDPRFGKMFDRAVIRGHLGLSEPTHVLPKPQRRVNHSAMLSS